MANVFGGGGSNCNTGGARRVIPTSSEVTQSNSSQTFSTQPNLYSKPQTNADGIDTRDFYTKVDINRFLKTKVDVGATYNKAEVDGLLTSLESEVNSSLTPFITQTELNSAISSSSQSILGDVQNNYYTKTNLYTRSEVDSLLDNVTVDPDDFILKTPTSLLQNTINPGTTQAISLTLIASGSPQVEIVQQWIDHQANSIGKVKKSGRIEFYGDMSLGQNIESWRPALDVSERRIAGVADPIHPFDAVNKLFMQDYITEVIDSIVQEDDKNYIVDALEY